LADAYPHSIMMPSFPFRSAGLKSLLLSAVACAALGCSSSSSNATATSSDAAVDGPTGPLTPAEARLACAFDAGSLASQTQDPTAPSGATIPINNIVVIMLENRSFDHYFQDLPNEGWSDVDVAPATATNLGIDGGPVPFVHADYEDGGAPGVYCFADTAHDWDSVHEEIGDGGMNGFAIANDSTHEDPMLGPPGFLNGSRAMIYYDAVTDLPFLYWAASNFAIGDHYFASVPGPTWPNREYLYGATSWGTTATLQFPTPNTPTVLDSLDAKGVSWESYSPGPFPSVDLFVRAPTFDSYKPNIASSFDEFTTAAQAGTLPSVSFIDPDIFSEGYDGDDEHPPAVMQVGENWVASIVSALTASPQWAHMAIFILYDEHGGLYDHVTPPSACVPDSIQPILTTDAGKPYGGFDQYGVRLPFVAISPYAKPHYVGHMVYDHTSVLRFIEARFDLPALTKRDANALVPWDVFDFTAAPNLTPPAVPTVPVNQNLIQQCAAIFTAAPVSTSGFQD
jgi:phospholipase C